jgi:catechol 2,3-dioxygenase-like lactoylglutathione lyase family enzyme
VKPVCDHIGLFTANAERMKEFYIHALDFEFGGETILAGSVVSSIFGIGSDCRFLKLHRDGFMLEIFEPLSPPSQEHEASRFGVNHWGFCTAERDLLLEKLRRECIPIIEIEKQGHRIYFLIDPDGNRIELRECREGD